METSELVVNVSRFKVPVYPDLKTNQPNKKNFNGTLKYSFENVFVPRCLIETALHFSESLVLVWYITVL